jgi:hypothetical protein
MTPTRGEYPPRMACGLGRLWQPVEVRVSSGFLIAVIIAARFLRLVISEVKRHVNTSRGT